MKHRKCGGGLQKKKYYSGGLKREKNHDRTVYTCSKCKGQFVTYKRGIKNNDK